MKLDRVSLTAFKSPVNGDSWRISEEAWNTHIKPCFDKNKVHYDLAKVDIKCKIPIKDCSQKYPILLHTTDSQFFVTGGITDNCRNYLSTKYPMSLASRP